VDIDYVTLLKSATAGRDFIRAYAYTGLDPENENQRQFQNFLGRNGYKVVSKDIRKYGDGKVKANLDIELVVDLMKTARNVDIAVVVSGDGDFAPAIRAVQEMGVRVEVISFRGNTSSDLIEVADTFTDITQLAKVEKSTRSGRRVAASAEGDLSMTAVPDKETEGAPRRRRRPAAAASAETPAEAPAEALAPVEARRGRRGGRATAAAEPARVVPAVAARSAAEAIAAAGLPALRALPGERLSRVAPLPAGEEAIPVEIVAPGDGLAPMGQPEDGSGEEVMPAEGVETREGQQPEGEGRRRRRRRGGRGRGRGRGREREAQIPTDEVAEVGADAPVDEVPPYPPTRPPQSTFGSVWDSQLGMNVPSRPAAQLPSEADEDLDEPEIPEYLLAERRRGGQGIPAGPGGRGRGGRGRGARGAYAAALDRERFGRPAAGTSPGWSGDRAGRSDRGPRGRRPGPGHGPARPPTYERPPSAEPWSEVPPDLEEQIRAQLAASHGQPASRPSSSPDAVVPAAGPQAGTEPMAPASRGAKATTRRRPAAAKTSTVEAAASAEPAGPVTRPRRRTTRTAAAAEAAPESTDAAASEKPKRRTRARTTPEGTSTT
jgi:uncharacterized LabA/DUF88 family protein